MDKADKYLLYIESVVNLLFNFNKQYAYMVLFAHIIYNQSELRFLLLQIDITEYTFVYVLRCMLTTITIF
jgi:hypothetical protein